MSEKRDTPSSPRDAATVGQDLGRVWFFCLLAGAAAGALGGLLSLGFTYLSDENIFDTWFSSYSDPNWLHKILPASLYGVLSFDLFLVPAIFLFFFGAVIPIQFASLARRKSGEIGVAQNVAGMAIAAFILGCPSLSFQLRFAFSASAHVALVAAFASAATSMFVGRLNRRLRLLRATNS